MTTIQLTSDQLKAVLTDLADVLDAIPADRASAPTPCTAYDIATLRGHVVGWLTAFTDGFAAPDGTCSDADAVRVEGTGAAQVRANAERLDELLPEAAARPLRIGESDMPGELSLSMMLWEYQVHGWDLARAIDHPWQPGVAGLEASLAFAPGMLSDDYQGEGKAFGPRVSMPADAPALDRLLGLSGRDPSWSPA